MKRGHAGYCSLSLLPSPSFPLLRDRATPLGSFCARRAAPAARSQCAPPALASSGAAVQPARPKRACPFCRMGCFVLRAACPDSPFRRVVQPPALQRSVAVTFLARRAPHAYAPAHPSNAPPLTSIHLPAALRPGPSPRSSPRPPALLLSRTALRTYLCRRCPPPPLRCLVSVAVRLAE
jgi:hypothetical protein